MRVIILAAGQGTRLRPLTDDLPKCLVDIGAGTILEHQLRNCLTVGLRDVAVVTGFEWRKVETHIAGYLEGELAGLRVETVYNPFYAISNNLVSLWAARHHMGDGFILINGDDVFSPRILSMLMEREREPIQVCIDRKAQYDADDMKVALGPDERITAINKMLAPEQTAGESIGIMRFSRGGAARLMSELEAMVRFDSAMKDWFTTAIERIAQSGFEVGAASVEGMAWAEIDFPGDLEHVRRSIARYSVEGA
jgi:L-glutamine-phosphate cytidylyltransferase